MAIGFRALSGPAVPAAGTAAVPPPALPTGTASGDLVVIALWWKYQGLTPTDPASWQSPLGGKVAGGDGGVNAIDGGDGAGIIYALEYDGVWTLPTITVGTGPNVAMYGAISYSKAAGESWASVVANGAGTTAGSSTAVNPPAAGTTIDLAAGDWLGTVIGVNGDNGTPTLPGTTTVAGVTLGTANTRLNLGTTIGQDARQASWDQAYSSGTASAGPDANLAYSVAGATTMGGNSIFYRLRVTTAAAASRPIPVISPYSGIF